MKGIEPSSSWLGTERFTIELHPRRVAACRKQRKPCESTLILTAGLPAAKLPPAQVSKGQFGPPLTPTPPQSRNCTVQHRHRTTCRARRDCFPSIASGGSRSTDATESNAVTGEACHSACWRSRSALPAATSIFPNWTAAGASFSLAGFGKVFCSLQSVPVRPPEVRPCLQQTTSYWLTKPPTYSAYHRTRFAIGAATAKSPSIGIRSTTIGSSVGVNWSEFARSSTRRPGEDRSHADHVHQLPKPVLGTCSDAQECVGQHPQSVAFHRQRERSTSTRTRSTLPYSRFALRLRREQFLRMKSALEKRLRQAS